MSIYKAFSKQVLNISLNVSYLKSQNSNGITQFPFLLG